MIHEQQICPLGLRPVSSMQGESCAGRVCSALPLLPSSIRIEFINVGVEQVVSIPPFGLRFRGGDGEVEDGGSVETFRLDTFVCPVS